MLLVGYLLGSIPFGLWLTRWVHGVDVRTRGSGNIGALNVLRVAGPKFGLGVLMLDALKGAVAVLLVRWLHPDAPCLPALTGLAAVLGHVFPVWLRFKGGKGVATALGVMLVLEPLSALAAALVYGGVMAVGRIGSVASLAAACTAVLVAFFTSPNPTHAWLTGVLLLLLCWTHRDNWRRLLARSEPRV